MRIKIGEFGGSGEIRMESKIEHILNYLAEQKEGWKQSYERAKRELDKAYAKKDVSTIIEKEKSVEFLKGRLMESSMLKTEIEKILK